MSNALAVLGGAPPAVVGQRKSLLNQAAQANIQASFATISYKGKVWQIKYRGEATQLKDERGLPQQAVDVVVVGVAAGISKQYYAKKFSEGDDASPDCFSVNGVTPDASSPGKQAAVCATCPMNKWGSKISDNGSKGKACQDSRRIAVVPDSDLQNEMFGGPVMLRLPPTTLANFSQYGAMLDKRGAGMEYVVTRLTFDTDVAYPKINFAPVRWLSQEEALEIVGPLGDGSDGVCGNPMIERMLNEAVEEVAHDPAATPETETANTVDPLGSGGPAAVFNQPAPVTPQVTVAPQPQPVAAPEPQPVAQPAAAKRGFGGTAVSAQPVAAPVAAKKGFGATVAATVVNTAPAQPAVAPPAPAQVVQAAPSDMEAAIDGLLNA